MTKYTYENGDIMNGNIEVGWLSENINHLFVYHAIQKQMVKE